MCLERWQRRQPSLAPLQDMLTTGKHLPRCWMRGPKSNTISHTGVEEPCPQVSVRMPTSVGSSAHDPASVLRKATVVTGVSCVMG